MARRSKEELVNMFKEFAGDRTDDSVISLMEDISDSVSDDNTRIADLESKLKENDRMWRERYIRRFSGLTEEGDVAKPDSGHVEESTTTVDDADTEDSENLSSDEAVAKIFGVEKEEL